MKNYEMICDNLQVTKDGILCFAGQRTDILAKQYGTPLYLMDEDRIRRCCRIYSTAMKQTFGDKGRTLYASKAACFKRMYSIMQEEDIFIDVVSCGEIHTAVRAGYKMENAYFHSNNKTDDDIRFALQNKVGHFVVDNEEELTAIDRIAKEVSVKPKILLRITPGIDTHTYEAIATGQVDSKFGSALETGQAEHITALALSLSHISLCGFHCHIGSQLFDSNVFFRAADCMLRFIADIRDRYGYVAEQLDLGGGYGVRYTNEDPAIDLADNIRQVGQVIHRLTKELSLPMPMILLEPGRSLVADAGLTLYTVGTVKRIPGYKNYVSVDGGMTDNPRFALYRAVHTFVAANRMNEECNMTADVVGRCCESGDILGQKVSLPETVCRGDLIAGLTTGAYTYSMASNYNRIPRPAVVMLSGGQTYVAVRRESLDDLIRLDE